MSLLIFLRIGGHDGVGTALGRNVGVALGSSEVDAAGLIVGRDILSIGVNVGSVGGGANGQTLCSGSFKSD